MQISGTPVADLKTLDESREKHDRGSRRTRHRPRKRKRRRKATEEVADDSVEEGEQVARPVSELQAEIPDVRIDTPEGAREPALSKAAPLAATRSLPFLCPDGAVFSTSSTNPHLGPDALPISPSKNTLRPTRSATSVFGASEASERPVKRRRLETLCVSGRSASWFACADGYLTFLSNSNNAIVLARHQMYHHRLAKGTGGKLPYGLSTKREPSR